LNETTQQHENCNRSAQFDARHYALLTSAVERFEIPRLHDSCREFEIPTS
jgi:hypothetical protein